MNGEEGLLWAIHETPGDDAVRLVYADWLEEHGWSDEAEFLRLHLPLSSVDNDNFWPTLFPREGPIGQRLSALLAVHEQAWLPPIPPSIGFEGLELACTTYWKPEACFYKGLPVCDITVSHFDWEQCFDAISAWIPLRMQVYLSICAGSGDDILPIISHPFSRRAAWLALRGQVDWEQPLSGDDGFAVPSRFPLAPEQIHAIASWPRVRNLLGICLTQVDEPSLLAIQKFLLPFVPVAVANKQL